MGRGEGVGGLNFHSHSIPSFHLQILIAAYSEPIGSNQKLVSLEMVAVNSSKILILILLFGTFFALGKNNPKLT
jgi:hypothetical protein